MHRVWLVGMDTAYVFSSSALHLNESKQIMRKYLESKICACGRTYGIIVTDEQRNPFHVGWLDEENLVLLDNERAFNSRSEAIKYCYELAMQWLSY